MKRLLVFVALFLCVGLSSCQCSEKPPVGPVEDGQAHVLPSPNTPSPSSPLRA